VANIHSVLTTLYESGGLTSTAIANLFQRNVLSMQDFMDSLSPYDGKPHFDSEQQIGPDGSHERWVDSEIWTAVGKTISDILNGRV
jgi:hypothetical protein